MNTLWVPNMFTLKNAWRIAAEATTSDLDIDETEQLSAVIQRLPMQISADITLTPAEQFTSYLCIRRFKETKTWFWLRPDFKRALLLFEAQTLATQGQRLSIDARR